MYHQKPGRFCSTECRAEWWIEHRTSQKVERTDPQVCRGCKESKPLADYPISAGEHGLRCKKCTADIISDAQKRAYHLRSLYGLKMSEWKDLFKKQLGTCAICRKQLPSLDKMLEVADKSAAWKDRDWNVDHCHVSGKVRGILCRKCNAGLGAFDDDPELLESAADYMEVHNGK